MREREPMRTLGPRLRFQTHMVYESKWDEAPGAVGAEAAEFDGVATVVVEIVAVGAAAAAAVVVVVVAVAAAAIAAAESTDGSSAGLIEGHWAACHMKIQYFPHIGSGMTGCALHRRLSRGARRRLAERAGCLMSGGLGGRYDLGGLGRRANLSGDGIGGHGRRVLGALNQVSNAKELRKLFLDPA
ncbi:hypothetical protein AG1IA_07018 [Rhizoctonia solani AG-1 IA]|uniref:Uncharacterized protein n=1 Tax=Thanatephorus cucumeris (strain AG1-IA) TaxID=983506 RepID=L8WLA8_THACA|nr:hypothetical protein AG1IA_07018 [Rhizoctonia solani AG-1 IA]